MAAEGELVGGYRLRALLGRGGIGEVWLAYDTRREREVALKLLTNHLATDADFRARFTREARVTARLESVHVIPVHDFGEIDGRPYLDMRRVSGGDLREVIAAAPDGVAPWRAVAIVAQIADALDAAHAAGLVHRDVKPANVLVASHHGEDFCYLTDFGIVKILDETGRSIGPGQTVTGAVLGTPGYMAPELFTLDGHASARSDVYALGCVLHEMLCGHPPFTGREHQRMAHHDRAGRVPRPSAHRADLAPFDPVVAAAVAADPAARFATAGALAGAAERALHGRPPLTPHRGHRPGRVGVLGGLALAVAAALVAAAALVFPPTVTGTASAGAPRPAATVTLRATPLALGLADPTDVALSPDHTRAYLGDTGPTGATAGTVAVVDLASNTVTATIRVGPDPDGLAVSPDGRRLYVANTGSEQAPGRNVSVVDTTSNTVVGSIPTDPGPLGMTLAPDGRTLYVACNGTNSAPGGTVAVVDTASNAVNRTVDVGSGTAPAHPAVTPDGRTLYVTDYGPQHAVDDTVSVVDTATDTVTRTLPVGYAPNGVAISPDGHRAYVAGHDGRGTVTVLDLADGHPVATITAPLNGPFQVAITPDGRYVIVASGDNTSQPPHNNAAVIDTATNTVATMIPLEGNPYAVVAADNHRAYLTTDHPNVYALDLS